MPQTDAITIDTAEEFPHLNDAPIVEAVIDLRARAESAWDESAISSKLKSSLPDYPKGHSLHAFSFTTEFKSADVNGQPQSPAVTHDRGWSGLRLTSQDGLNVATFTRDGFSLSRLKPYQDWKTFKSEALRLWALHVGLAAVSDVQRLGIRSINRIEVPVAALRIDHYLRDFVGAPSGLPTGGFLHHDILAVPGHPYTVNLIRTMQAPEKADSTTLALIVDIDVFSAEPVPPNGGTIEKRLAEMHWLRNTVFFRSVTGKVVEKFT